jgi:hypothetical protein
LFATSELRLASFLFVRLILGSNKCVSPFLGVALVCWSPDASHYIVVTWFGVPIHPFQTPGTSKIPYIRATCNVQHTNLTYLPGPADSTDSTGPYNPIDPTICLGDLLTLLTLLTPLTLLTLLIL